MAYRCNKCGEIYEELEVRAYTDVDGYTRYENVDMCHCGGDLISGDFCEHCGKFSENLFEELCDECYELLSEEE